MVYSPVMYCFLCCVIRCCLFCVVCCSVFIVLVIVLCSLFLLLFIVRVTVHCSCYFVHCSCYCSLFLYCASLFLYCGTLTDVFRAFSSVVRQMPGYNSQRRGTARTFQFSFLCIMCTVCVQICYILLPPGVNPTAVKYIYISYHFINCYILVF
jgi:hypothetical protein